MKKLAILLGPLLIIDMILTVYAARYGAFPLLVDLGSPTAYLNIYIHVPIAWTSYMIFAASMISAILYLWKGRETFDRMVYSFILVGLLYSLATLVTGSMWAMESWGTPWNWDPRETGVFLLFLAYIVYFALRFGISDPDRGSRISAVYAIAAYSMVPISYISAQIATSLHPTPQYTGSFVAQPNVLWLFVSKTLIVTLVGLLLGYLFMKRGRIPKVMKYLGLIIVIMGLISAGYIASPYTSGKVHRVIDASLKDGMISSIVLDNGNKVVYSPPIPSPVKPAEVEGRPTIINHLVIVRDNTLTVVIQWSVAFSVAVYLTLIGLLTFYVSREKKIRE